MEDNYTKRENDEWRRDIGAQLGRIEAQTNRTNGRDYMCQGFQMSLYSVITAVGFAINSKDGSGNVGYAVWIDNADSSSHPTGTVAVGIGGFTEISNATLIADGAKHKYALATNVNVTIGSNYVVCFAPWDTVNHVWISSYNDWPSSTANPYHPTTFSAAKRTHLDNTFANPSDPDSGNDDILFDIYGSVGNNTHASVGVGTASAGVGTASVGVN